MAPPFFAQFWRVDEKNFEVYVNLMFSISKLKCAARLQKKWAEHKNQVSFIVVKARLGQIGAKVKIFLKFFEFFREKFKFSTIIQN